MLTKQRNATPLRSLKVQELCSQIEQSRNAMLESLAKVRASSNDITESLKPKQLKQSLLPQNIQLKTYVTSHPFYSVGALALGGFLFGALTSKPKQNSVTITSSRSLNTARSSAAITTIPLGEVIRTEFSSTMRKGIERSFELLRQQLAKSLSAKNSSAIHTSNNEKQLLQDPGLPLPY